MKEKMKRDNILRPLKSNKKNFELSSISKETQSSEAKFQNEDLKQPFLKCRHLVAFVGFWCFSLTNYVRTNTSINIVAMVNHSAVARRARIKSDSCPLLVSNSTQTKNVEVNEDGEFLWSPEIQGYILGSYFLGYIIAQIPSGRLVNIYGCKWFLFASSFVTAVATFLMPVFAWISVEALIALQFIRGSSQGLLHPAICVLVANWFTRSERGQMFSIMLSGLSIGSIASAFLSGFLCDSSGKWPSSFYTTGAIGIVVSILVVFCIHESPGVHPRISRAELNYILNDQESKLTLKRSNPPWRKIFTSAPVYALFYSNIGQGFGVAHFLMAHPLFLGTILHYPIDKNAMYTALTFLLQFVAMQVSTYLAALMIKKKIASIDFTRKFWTLVACSGFSSCMLGIYLSGCSRSLSAIFAILSSGFTGCALAGSTVSAPEMSPTFAGILGGCNMALTCLSAVILPLIVGFLTEGKQTIEQWNKVFFVVIGVVMSSGIVFSIFGSADVQPWNFVQEGNNKEKTESKQRF